MLHSKLYNLGPSYQRVSVYASHMTVVVMVPVNLVSPDRAVTSSVIIGSVVFSMTSPTCLLSMLNTAFISIPYYL